MKKPEKLRFSATYSQRLKQYQQCPELFAEDLFMIFTLYDDEKDIGIHNHVVKKILDFCPDIDSLLINVARAIVKTSKESHNPKKQD